jgi:DNA-cytosine methyltransferase
MIKPPNSSKTKQFTPYVADYLRAAPKNIQLVDLFAGIGGFHYGIGAAARQLGMGVQTQLVSEITDSCRLVYEQNHGNPKSIQGDINEINLKKFVHGEADFLTAGFPCQPFSNSGRKMGLSDPRGQFYERIQEIILAFRAKTFILENVPGMTKNGGKSLPSQLAFLENQKIGTTMQTLEKAMIHGLQSSPRAKSRYNIKWVEVNSAHLGSPQVRKRVYIIGVRADLGEVPDLSFLKVKSRETVFKDIAEHDPSDVLGLSKNQEKNIRSFMTRGSVPSHTEGMRRVGQAYLCEGGNVGQAYHAYGLVPTLTKVWARFLPIYFPTSNETLPIVGEADFTPGRDYGKGQIRRASVREVMRLQGFPDSFMPHERDSEAYQHAGNAVNSLVVQAIAEQMLPIIR